MFEFNIVYLMYAGWKTAHGRAVCAQGRERDAYEAKQYRYRSQSSHRPFVSDLFSFSDGISSRCACLMHPPSSEETTDDEPHTRVEGNARAQPPAQQAIHC